MIYALADFTESLDRVSISREDIVEVEAAWGVSDGGYSEWSGGFLLRMRPDYPYPWMYLTGWCDTTGWGCQDGAELTPLDEISEDICEKLAPDATWDRFPADLNCYIETGEGKW